MNTTANLSAFNRSIANVIRYSRKPEAEIVNKAMKDIAFRAAQFTPKTTKSKVLRDVGARTDKLWALASIRANRKFGKGRWNAAQRKLIADKLKTGSVQGIGALRAGWAPAIIALGGSFRGAGSLRANGSVSQGRAVKATETRLAALISNTAVTVDKDGKAFSAEDILLARSALMRAVEFVTNDRNEYARRKMEQMLRQNSDR